MVLAGLLPEVVQLKLEQLIAVAKEIVPSKFTLKADYANLLKLREMHSLLKSRMEEENSEDKERIKARKEGYDVYLKPMEEILADADPLIRHLYYEIKAEEKAVIEGLKDENEVKGRFIEFVNFTVRAIVIAPDNKEITRIQKLIGSEKSKESFYGELHPELKNTCDALLKLSAERKEILKNNAKLEKEYEVWLAAGDIAKATQLKEQMEANDMIVADNAKIIAESAFKQVSWIQKADEDIESALIRPRTHRWSWRVDNIELLFKKRPELVEKTPNTKAINALMKEKNEAEELDKEIENVFDGLVFYYKPFFTEIKSTKDNAS